MVNVPLDRAVLSPSSPLLASDRGRLTGPHPIIKIGQEPISGGISSALFGGSDPDHERAPRGLYHVIRDDRQAVDLENALDLHEQPMEEPEIAAGDPRD